MNRFPVGKLPADELQRLLDRFEGSDPRVVVGPSVGEDAAVIDMGDRYLVAKTDPVTFATDEVGWYAVHVNANDLACCGATPRWFLACLLLPENHTTPELTERIFAQISSACKQLGAAVCGGHTEITHGLGRPIVIGQMLGEVARDALITSSGAQIGDVLILTKGFALEGTALLAKEKGNELRGTLSETEIQRCANFLRAPGISVVKDAQLALGVGGVHALHDPTEGGVAMGLHELAQAARVGLVVDEDRLPVLPECDAVCRHFGLNPLGVIASGSLLIVADRHRSETIVNRLQAENVAAAIIGEVVTPEKGCQIRVPDKSHKPLPIFSRDEIARLFVD